MAHYEGTESGGEGRQLSRLSESGAKKRLNFSEGVTGGGGVGSEGVGRGSGGGSTPVLHRAAGSGTLPVGGTPGREQPSGLVRMREREREEIKKARLLCTHKLLPTHMHTHTHTHALGHSKEYPMCRNPAPNHRSPWQHTGLGMAAGDDNRTGRLPQLTS